MDKILITDEEMTLLYYCFLRYYRGVPRASRSSMRLLMDLRQVGLDVKR